MNKPKNFNHIKQWIEPLLAERGWSVDDLWRRCGISRSVIYYYIHDRHRPSEEVMARICKALDRPFEEGLAQYTPRKNGRPFGTSGDRKPVTSHKRRS